MLDERETPVIGVDNHLFPFLFSLFFSSPSKINKMKLEKFGAPLLISSLMEGGFTFPISF